MAFTSTALENFTQDFKLERKNEQVCFDGAISFPFDGTEIQFYTKIIIVKATLTNLDTIYLLDTKLQTFHIPEIFRSDRDEYRYTSDKCLTISGKTLDFKAYSIKIECKV